MKYIKKNLQVVESEINEDGYYVVGNITIHPDVFHQQYQPLDFTLTAEEMDVTEVVFNSFILDRPDLREFIKGHPKEFALINNIINRIKQWQNEHSN